VPLTSILIISTCNSAVHRHHKR